VREISLVKEKKNFPREGKIPGEGNLESVQKAVAQAMKKYIKD
jgi:hypothetical protein